MRYVPRVRGLERGVWNALVNEALSRKTCSSSLIWSAILATLRRGPERAVQFDTDDRVRGLSSWHLTTQSDIQIPGTEAENLIAITQMPLFAPQRAVIERIQLKARDLCLPNFLQSPVHEMVTVFLKSMARGSI
ncbi:hypothetical protein DMY87_21855 [Rhizobium wuzhouense]|uniref:Uncharacterized protein n=1 Tax=Rhizobium wuzhouense TaxID=1986026 RepID=A0ABX5NKR2_9HYPH|nr:hypothetical protein DMY87_21855 [Rhizobium wuzhouense]